MYMYYFFCAGINIVVGPLVARSKLSIAATVCQTQSGRPSTTIKISLNQVVQGTTYNRGLCTA